MTDVIDSEAFSSDADIIDVEPNQPTAGMPAEVRAGPVANPLDADPAQFSRQIAQRSENYESLVGWLVSTMVPDYDTVRVHFVNRNRCNAGGPPPYGTCRWQANPGHWSDPDISRRGAEKICGLLGLGTRFLGMQDFRRKALEGVTISDVIIDCVLYNHAGDELAQGTGSASRAEFKDDLNRTMKAACKRAHVDAVKRVAGLSGIATEIKRRQGGDDRIPPPPPPSPASTVRTWNTGAALSHCPIGKHEGKPWRDIPTEYLEAIEERSRSMPDIHRAVTGELDRRRNRAGGSPGSAHDQSPPASDEFDDDIPF